MPGYLLHFAACSSENLKDIGFMRGVEAPDILKKWYKIGGIQYAEDKYNSLRVDGMPDFSSLKERIEQKETMYSTCGMHYGLSSCPKVVYFGVNLSEKEKSLAFYRGYLWHLLTDFAMYFKLDIDSKFKTTLAKFQDDENFQFFKQQQVKRLHSDWDKTNSLVRKTYPDIILPQEVLELNVVKYIEGQPYYVDWEILKSTIDFLRTMDPLKDPENTIFKILAFCTPIK